MTAIRKAFDAISGAMLQQMNDPERCGEHTIAFVELIHLRAVYGSRNVDLEHERHKRLGRPAPDSGHRFWQMPEGMEPEDIAYWNAMVQKWKSGVAELQAKGLTPRLD